MTSRRHTEGEVLGTVVRTRSGTRALRKILVMGVLSESTFTSRKISPVSSIVAVTSPSMLPAELFALLRASFLRSSIFILPTPFFNVTGRPLPRLPRSLMRNFKSGDPRKVTTSLSRAHRSVATAFSSRSAIVDEYSSAPGDGITTRTGRPITRTRIACRTSLKEICHCEIITLLIPDGSKTFTS